LSRRDATAAQGQLHPLPRVRLPDSRARHRGAAEDAADCQRAVHDLCDVSTGTREEDLQQMPGARAYREQETRLDLSAAMSDPVFHVGDRVSRAVDTVGLVRRHGTVTATIPGKPNGRGEFNWFYEVKWDDRYPQSGPYLAVGLRLEVACVP